MQTSGLLTVRVKPDIADRLQEFSKLMDRSKSYLAAEAIEEYLDIHEWQIKAIKEGIAAAEKGKVKDLEKVKQHWEKKLANKNH